MEMNDMLLILIKAKEDSDIGIAVIMALENDLLYVAYEIDQGSDMTELNEWFFENNIVAKHEHITINDPRDGYFPYGVTGYRFKDAESAMAFKIRWT